MRKTKAIFAVMASALILASSAALAACSKGTADSLDGPDPGPGPTGSVFTITLNANGGVLAGAASVETQADGTIGAANFPAAPSHTDSTKRFNGWYLNAEGTGAAVTATTYFDRNTEIFAGWGNGSTPIIPSGGTYTVTFHLEGGNIGGQTTDVTKTTNNQGYLSSANIPAKPGKAGENFYGWTTTRNDKSTKVDIDETYQFTANTHLYAYYDEIVVEREILLTGKSAAFKFTDATIVITLAAKASWGDQDSEEVYIGGSWNSTNRFKLDGTSTYSIEISLPDIIYVGFTQLQGDSVNGKYAAVSREEFTDGKVHTVASKNNYSADDWDAHGNWGYTLTKTDITYK